MLLCFDQDVKRGLEEGTLLQGKLRINVHRRSTAFVTAAGGVLPFDIFLDSEKARNRAQDGDQVGSRHLPSRNAVAPMNNGAATRVRNSTHNPVRYAS